MAIIEKYCNKCKITFKPMGVVPFNFCHACGKYLDKINASGEQPFHLPDSISKSLKECRKLLDKIAERNAKEQEKIKFKPIYKEYRAKETVKSGKNILDDPKWFEKLKKLKF